MAIITIPLVPQIVDGQVIDAAPVMALANYIAAQVNANAQPLSITPNTEWVGLGASPSFISATSFSAPGNLTATLQPDLRIQTTNTGGTIYSSVLTSSFGGGITTVTVINDSGVLDSGISNVNVSIQNPVNLSQPQRSAVMVTMANGTALAASTTYVLGENLTPTIQFDTLSEFSTGTGLFTAKQKGVYRIIAKFIFAQGTFSSTSDNSMSILVNGSIVSTSNIPQGTLFVSKTNVPWVCETFANLAQGGTLQAKVTIGTFSSSPIGSVGNLATDPCILIQRVA